MPDSLPGFAAIVESEEKQIHWSGPDGQDQASHQTVLIDSTAVDAGNTPTTTIRGGVMLGILDADGNAYPYDSDHPTGLDSPVGILPQAVDILGREVLATDRSTKVTTSGLIKASQVHGLDQQSRARLVRSGFKFDTPLVDGAAFLVHPRRIIPKVTDYTVVAADQGSLFIASAADCKFTLPTLAVGLTFDFLMVANFELTVTAADGEPDTIIYNTATAELCTSLIWSTANEQIGARCRMLAIPTATGVLRWAVEVLTGFTVTTA